uniref:SOUL heme-binding protein n=1 Tax=Pyramimonas obovata TaxID=1411642 RepID=A0A7S0QUH0_9CHLO|mmetsp:Transcript_12786/g.26980  ORF Transcript_12786/g.26980 Transcript_12786/m.26980 type:complete len:278 (+) Transcript_12786:62-895(+)|eukprot:CAMPEP_0118933442 /NCGR_PEP_ID=MMETSP1169-20130426/11988_1 /TAXON_ID=36882 /ORGANISM="Pyramimonas obovata, Strain CCMP722" /LENGTH=277 /DNA_ID=CAMNT_0006876201 /DNA_START=62 /DNA_END=895 /DNA_ORIENTATION=-
MAHVMNHLKNSCLHVPGGSVHEAAAHPSRLQLPPSTTMNLSSSSSRTHPVVCVAPANRSTKLTQSGEPSISRGVSCPAFLKNVFGGKEEEPEEEYDGLSPPFTVVAKKDLYEVRLYETYLFIETAYDTRAEGIAALATYFDGGNSVGVKIPSTQPVTMQYEPTDEGKTLKKTMRLFVPKVEGAPPAMPTGYGLGVNVSGGELVAVMRFAGNITPEVADVKCAQLKKALGSDGIRLASPDSEGVFRMAQYGQLYQLAERKNELWLRINPEDLKKLQSS